MENGPGPHVCAFSPGGGKNCSTMFLACPSQGLSLMPRHTTIVMIPPGLRLVRMLRKPGHRVLEKLGAEARKTEVMHRLERICSVRRLPET